MTYLNNPQWKITVPEANAGLLLMLESFKDFAIHLLLVEGGKRVSSVSVRDILAESGPYRHEFCYCEIGNIKRKSDISMRCMSLTLPTYESQLDVTLWSLQPSNPIC